MRNRIKHRTKNWRASSTFFSQESNQYCKDTPDLYCKLQKLQIALSCGRLYALPIYARCAGTCRENCLNLPLDKRETDHLREDGNSNKGHTSTYHAERYITRLKQVCNHWNASTEGCCIENGIHPFNYSPSIGRLAAVSLTYIADSYNLGLGLPP